MGVNFLAGSQEAITITLWLHLLQCSSLKPRFRGRCRLPIRDEAPRRAGSSASSHVHRYLRTGRTTDFLCLPEDGGVLQEKEPIRIPLSTLILATRVDFAASRLQTSGFNRLLAPCTSDNQLQYVVRGKKHGVLTD